MEYKHKGINETKYLRMDQKYLWKTAFKKIEKTVSLQVS